MHLISPEELTSAIADRLARQSAVLVALDGRCGSGKTTLAEQLAERFPQSITVHTDDFYLPPSRRVTGWEKIPCANMDIQRLRDEVVAPARAGQAFSYQAYSCREDAYLPPRPLGSAPLVIVEGSYSHHPSLAPYYDIRIFVTCSPDEQARRSAKREEAVFDFVEQWIPLEEGYFANYGIEENAEILVVTDWHRAPVAGSFLFRSNGNALLLH